MKRIADNIRSAFSTRYERPTEMQQSIREDEQTPSHDKDHIDEDGAAGRGETHSAYANVASSAEIQYC